MALFLQVHQCQQPQQERLPIRLKLPQRHHQMLHQLLWVQQRLRLWQMVPSSQHQSQTAQSLQPLCLVAFLLQQVVLCLHQLCLVVLWPQRMWYLAPLVLPLLLLM
jgi:hypothetical protein